MPHRTSRKTRARARLLLTAALLTVMALVIPPGTAWSAAFWSGHIRKGPAPPFAAGAAFAGFAGREPDRGSWQTR